MSMRAFFFDLEGVIVRTEYQAPSEHLAARLIMNDADVTKIVFESETSRQASLGAISTDEHWAAVTRKLRRPAPEAQAIRQEFFGGDVVDRLLLDFIRGLRPRYKTGVISNAWPDMRDYIVENKFDDAFDSLVVSAEIGVIKPEPKIYQIALEQFQVQPNEAAFVDDTRVNVEAACKLGMHGILFQSQAQVLDELKQLSK